MQTLSAPVDIPSTTFIALLPHPLRTIGLFPHRDAFVYGHHYLEGLQSSLCTTIMI